MKFSYPAVILGFEAGVEVCMGAEKFCKVSSVMRARARNERMSRIFLPNRPALTGRSGDAVFSETVCFFLLFLQLRFNKPQRKNLLMHVPLEYLHSRVLDRIMLPDFTNRTVQTTVTGNACKDGFDGAVKHVL